MKTLSPAQSCEARLRKARTALLLDHPFFGTLLFRLCAMAKHSIKTMATDGVSLFYNPNFDPRDATEKDSRRDDTLPAV